MYDKPIRVPHRCGQKPFASPNNGSMANVLLVDGDQRRARLSTWALQPHHDVAATHSLEAAAEHPLRPNADAVIFSTDLYEGDQSAAVLRAITRGANEPPRVIAVQEGRAVPTTAIPAPVDAVITTPFDAEDLLSVLNDVLVKPYE